jgi:lipopolysaccharide exporter
MTGHSLKAAVRRGIFWTMSARMMAQIASFVRVPILARLLSPDDFGLMGIMTAVLFYVDVISRSGFETALVQQRDVDSDDFSVAWTLNVLRGLGQGLVLALLAAPVGFFYETPQLTTLLLIVAPQPVLVGLRSIGLVRVYRDLNFRSLTIYELGDTLIAVVVTLGMAFWLHSVWALLAGVMASALYGLLASYIFAPHAPRIHFDRPKATRLWRFGRWEWVGGVAVAVFQSSDNLFVGKFLGLTVLGYYAMAYRLGNLATTEVVNALRKVMFPAFSTLQDDMPRLRQTFLTLFQISAALGPLVAVGLVLLSSPLVNVLLGPKWQPVIPVLQVLALWGSLDVLKMTTPDLFRALGHPDWFAKATLVKIVVLAVTIYPLSAAWGIVGTAVAVVLAALADIPFTLRWVCQALGFRLPDLLRPLLAPLVGAMLVAPVYLLGQGAWGQLADLWQLVLGGACIVLVYALVQVAADAVFGRGIVTALRFALQR